MFRRLIFHSKCWLGGRMNKFYQLKASSSTTMGALSGIFSGTMLAMKNCSIKTPSISKEKTNKYYVQFVFQDNRVPLEMDQRYQLFERYFSINDSNIVTISKCPNDIPVQWQHVWEILQRYYQCDLTKYYDQCSVTKDGIKMEFLINDRKPLGLLYSWYRPWYMIIEIQKSNLSPSKQTYTCETSSSSPSNILQDVSKQKCPRLFISVHIDEIECY